MNKFGYKTIQTNIEKYLVSKIGPRKVPTILEIEGKRRHHVPSSLLRDAPSRTKPKMFGKGELHRIDLEAIFE